MALQHLRSATANKRPTPVSMSDGQAAMNTNLASPGLFFKDSNGDLVKVGPVHVGTTAPNVSPAVGGQTGNSKGEQWLDTSGTNPVLKIWDGSAWQSQAGEFVNASGDTMTGALGVPLGSAALPSVYPGTDTNTGLYSPGADQIALGTNGQQRLAVNSSGVVLVGPGTARAVGGATVGTLVVETLALGMSCVRNSADTSGAIIALGKSRAAAANGVTAVQNGDILGEIRFAGANGTDLTSIGAHIRATVDGEVGTLGDTTDMPTSLAFSTTPDGAASATERLGISSAGLATFTPTPNSEAIRVGGTGGISAINGGYVTLTSNAKSFGNAADFQNILANSTTGLGVISPMRSPGNATVGGVWVAPGNATAGTTYAWSSMTPALTWDTSGQVGIGTTSTDSTLTVGNTGGAGDTNVFRIYRGGSTSHYAEFSSVTGAAVINSQNGAGGGFIFRGDSLERARIDSSGRLGIGTSSPGSLLDLGNGTAGRAISWHQSPTAGYGHIWSQYSAATLWMARGFKGSTTANAYESSVSSSIARSGVQCGNGSVTLYTDAAATIAYGSAYTPSPRLHVDSSGNVGIGTTSPGSALDVDSASSATAIRVNGNNTAAADTRLILSTGGNGGSGRGVALNMLAGGLANSVEVVRLLGLQEAATATASAAAFAIQVANTSGTLTERARIDSSGRLLVGTSTSVVVGAASSQGQIQIADTAVALQSITTYANSVDGPYLIFGKSRGASVPSYTIVQNNDQLGTIRFAGSNGTDLGVVGASIAAFSDGTPGANDMPGRIVFATTSDGAAAPTEACRITSDKYLRFAASTGGVQFNGDTAAANALDDYEEGTFTPTIVGSTLAGTGTYTSQVGRYTKIGNRVCFSIQMAWSAHTGTGNMSVAGLPVAVTTQTSAGSQTAAITSTNLTTPAGTYLTNLLPANNTVITLYSMATGGGALAALAMDTAATVYISGVYEAA